MISNSNNLVSLDLKEECLLVIDLVESTRLLQENEAVVVKAWREFTSKMQDEISSRTGVRLVKSLGDGMFIESDSVKTGVSLAGYAHELSAELSKKVIDNNTIAVDFKLRIGVHRSRVYVDEQDVYGVGANLAARLASIAKPGETIMSSEVRDVLVDGYDGKIVDLGECFVKHFPLPVRAWKIAGNEPANEWSVDEAGSTLYPRIAILPFSCNGRGSNSSLGVVIADHVSTYLSAIPNLRIVSRLATSINLGTSQNVPSAGAHFGADYIVSGNAMLDGTRILVFYELADATKSESILRGKFIVTESDICSESVASIEEVCMEMVLSIVQSELSRVRLSPMPNLKSYSLLFGGVALMHRSTSDDFVLSRRVFEQLLDRHPRTVMPRIWRAAWCCLRVVQGLPGEDDKDAARAQSDLNLALELNPHESLAHAVLGFTHCHLTRNYDAAIQSLETSIAINPSQVLGHLFLAVAKGMKGDFLGAIPSVNESRRLSPCDPLRYLIDTIAGYVLLASNNHDEALDAIQNSIRLNRFHAHSWRILTVTYVELGRMEEARRALAQVLRLQPDLSVSAYVRGAKPNDETRKRFADALAQAGLKA